MKELIIKGVFNIMGRPDAYVLSLAENKLPNKRKELTALFGTKFLVEGKELIFKGLEAHGHWDDEVSDVVAFLLKE